MATFENLLRKKTWTAVEIGRLYVLYYKKLLSQENPGVALIDIDRMSLTCKDERGALLYRHFSDVLRLLLDKAGLASLMARSEITKKQLILMGHWAARQNEISMEAEPLVLTRTQYKELKAQAQAYVRRQKFSIDEAVFALADYIADKGLEGQTPEIEKATEDLLNEPVNPENEDYWNYCFKHKLGVFVDSEGNEIPAKDFEPYKETLDGKEGFSYYYGLSPKSFRELSEGAGEILSSFSDDVIEEAFLSYNSDTAIFNGNLIPLEEKVKLTEFLPHLGNKLTYVFKPVDNLPTEKFSRYHLFLNLCASNGSNKEEKLKKEYGALYTAIRAYIEGLLPDASKDDSPITFGALADKGEPSFLEDIQDEERCICDYFRGSGTENGYFLAQRASEGIAILQGKKAKGSFDSLMNGPLGRHSDRFGENLKIYAQIDDSVHGIKSSVAWILAFKEVLSIYAQALKIPELEDIWGVPALDFETRLAQFNSLLSLEGKGGVLKTGLDCRLEHLVPEKEKVDALRKDILSLSTAKLDDRIYKIFDDSVNISREKF